MTTQSLEKAADVSPTGSPRSISETPVLNRRRWTHWESAMMSPYTAKAIAASPRRSTISVALLL
jgi:hypothetical protein